MSPHTARLIRRYLVATTGHMGAYRETKRLWYGATAKQRAWLRRMMRRTIAVARP